MIIEKLLLREGMIENLDTFSEKRNLIYSKTNTKGKSTFVRLLFYALGYPIPNMRGIKYEDIITEITFSEKGQKYTATRENNLLTLFSENSRIEFTLPSQHMSFLSFVFKYENIKVLKNLLGFICNGVQREHNKKLNNGLPILHKVPPKRDYGRYFCIMAEKGGTSHGGLTEKLSPFFHAKKQEVNAYAVRQDTYKLNQRIRQMEFLSRYSIDTLAPLETYCQAKQGEIVQLTAERKSLYKTNPDSPRIQQVNTALKQLRQEERLCRKIAEHSIEVQQHLTEARSDRAAQQQREQERARDLRPDITTR